MKLTKQKKERIESYIDMMEFNCDIRSCYTADNYIEVLNRLRDVLSFETYIKSDKPMLQLLERRFHKNKINWSL
jgi:hypothetical protein